jgi:hypothetical protein
MMVETYEQSSNPLCHAFSVVEKAPRCSSSTSYNEPLSVMCLINSREAQIFASPLESQSACKGQTPIIRDG